MQLLETAKFRRQRKSLRGEKETDALKKTILRIMADPAAGKKMAGELTSFYLSNGSISGRPQRLIYRYSADTLVLFSFGPRQGSARS
jgi:hypothetical protein